MQKITQELIDSANEVIDQQCEIHRLDKTDINIRMAMALENIWAIGYDYDGYENSIEELRHMINFFIALSLATEYWKTYNKERTGDDA